MIIVLRGTNGSGKSHTVRSILAQGRQIGTRSEDSTLIRLPRVKRPVLIIGPYTKGRSMGGCDCIRTPSTIYRLIDIALERNWHVLLEGVVLATKPYLKMFEDGIDLRYAFLDPPNSVCLENIATRQRKKGRTVSVSDEAMDRKRTRAHMMFIAAKDARMVTKRFTDATDVIHWIGYQLRRP